MLKAGCRQMLQIKICGALHKVLYTPFQITDFQTSIRLVKGSSHSIWINQKNTLDAGHSFLTILPTEWGEKNYRN